jgi:hypothetical protein
MAAFILSFDRGWIYGLPNKKSKKMLTQATHQQPLQEILAALLVGAGAGTDGSYGPRLSS